MVHRMLDANAWQAAAIGQAACMAQHVANAYRPGQGLRLHGLALARHIGDLIGPGRHKPRNRIIQLEMALLIKAHQGD